MKSCVAGQDKVKLCDIPKYRVITVLTKLIYPYTTLIEQLESPAHLDSQLTVIVSVTKMAPNPIEKFYVSFQSTLERSVTDRYSEGSLFQKYYHVFFYA